MKNLKIVLNHSRLKELVESLKSQNEKIVFTNGCFDILHPGHIRYLSRARDLGDKLIVALNSDSSIKKLKKKHPPIQEEGARLEVLAALEFVDFVTLFDGETPLEIITMLAPNVLVKGGDWSVENIVGAEFVKSNGGEVHSIPITYKASTSDIIQRIKKLN